MLDLIKKIILDLVKIKCNKVGRKSRESDEHFLDMFIAFCKDYTKWKCLDCHIDSKYTSDNYRKKMKYWTDNNIFDLAFDVVNHLIISKCVKMQPMDMFIDATNIRNINGSYTRNKDVTGKTLLGRLHCDKMKRGLKVTVVITKENQLVDIHVTGGQSHDITVIPKVYEKLTHNFKSNKRHRVNLVCDKGYQSLNNKKRFAIHKIHYICPKKRKMITVDKLNYYNNLLLKKRHVVENYFAHLKQYSRIRLMYDKMVSMYKGFLLLAIMDFTKNIIFRL